MRSKGDEIIRNFTKVVSQFWRSCTQINIAPWFSEAEQSKIMGTWNKPASNRNRKSVLSQQEGGVPINSNMTLSHVLLSKQYTKKTRKLHRSAYQLCVHLIVFSTYLNFNSGILVWKSWVWRKSTSASSQNTAQDTQVIAIYTARFVISFIYLFINEFRQGKVLSSLKRQHGLWGPPSLLIQLVQRLSSRG